MNKLLALALAGLFGISTAAAGGYEVDPMTGQLRYNFQKNDKAQEQRQEQLQRENRALERRLRDQQDQMRNLEAQRNAARQRQQQQQFQYGQQHRPQLYGTAPIQIPSR
jgi:TolA-binding protein